MHFIRFVFLHHAIFQILSMRSGGIRWDRGIHPGVGGVCPCRVGEGGVHRQLHDEADVAAMSPTL